MIQEHFVKIEMLANMEICSSCESIEKVQYELKKAKDDLSSLTANLTLVSSLINCLDAIEPSKIKEFHDEIKNCDNKLDYLENLLTECLKSLSIIHSETRYINESIQMIENWIVNDCECILKVEFELLNFEQIEKQIEKQRVIKKNIKSDLKDSCFNFCLPLLIKIEFGDLF
jgi:hypothetical protein